jgi:hypothetical protein
MKSYWQSDLTGGSDDSDGQTAVVANANQPCACEVYNEAGRGASDDNRRLGFAGMADAIHNRNDSSRMETAPQSQLNRNFSTPDGL